MQKEGSMNRHTITLSAMLFVAGGCSSSPAPSPTLVQAYEADASPPAPAGTARPNGPMLFGANAFGETLDNQFNLEGKSIDGRLDFIDESKSGFQRKYYGQRTLIEFNGEYDPCPQRST